MLEQGTKIELLPEGSFPAVKQSDFNALVYINTVSYDRFISGEYTFYDMYPNLKSGIIMVHGKGMEPVYYLICDHKCRYLGNTISNIEE